jgi:hypothetical protein
VPDTDPAKPYFVDRKGDADNIKYGSLNRYATPAYRRFGYGSIIGLSTDIKIDRESSTDRGILLTGPRSQRRERILTSKHAGRDANRKLRFVKATTISGLEESADFIDFSITGKRKRNEDNEAHETHYRDIERQQQKQSPVDSDLEDEEDAELDDASAEITQKNSVLIQRTRDYPQDLQAWLDLVKHQEAMMSLGRSSSQLSGTDQQHLAEVRISTLEQAIRKLGSDQPAQIKLHLSLMTEASKAWTESKLSAKWLEILANYPSNPELWMKYLDHVQGVFSSFKYETCRATFHRCFQMLRSSAQPASPEMILHVMIRLTSMIRDAGYQELGVAIWQALLEYHMLSPDSTGASEPTDDSLQLFEEFWDSEVLRIGEADAKGWRSYHANSSSSTTLPLKSPVQAHQSVSGLENFRIREFDHMHKLFYPGRTTDEIGEDDPFHLVLYSDVEEYLQVLPRHTPHHLILEAFLCFAGMHRPPRLGSNRRSWSLDPLLQSQSLGASRHVGHSHSLDQTYRNFMDGPQHYEMTLDLLFDNALPNRNSDDKLWIIRLNFVRHTLKLLATSSSYGEVVGEYLLAFEQHYYPAESVKTAKKLLKANPTSLRLYNAYGLIESSRGNHTKADQVFSAALSMQRGATPLSAPGSLHLLYSWCWEALRQDNKIEAVWRMVSPQGSVAVRADPTEKPSHTASLRIRTILAETKERALLGQDHLSAVTATSLLALLVYLSNDQNTETALAVHGNLSTWFNDHDLSLSAAAELHAQFIAQLLAYHATHAPVVKPALLRNSLEPMIKRFPNNTYLLALYAANEARFSIDDRVRTIMHQGIFQRETATSVVGWLFAIHYEMKRGEIAGSTSHSVRALFKKAEDDAGAYSPAIWTNHVLFEMSEAEKERARRPYKRNRKDGKKSKDEAKIEDAHWRVKETFFRGLTHLPWSKDYMMLAFSHLLGGVLTREELRKVCHVMVEKELRIYVDIDIDS